MKNRRKAGEYENKIQNAATKPHGKLENCMEETDFYYMSYLSFFLFFAGGGGEALDPNCAPE